MVEKLWLSSSTTSESSFRFSANFRIIRFSFSVLADFCFSDIERFDSKACFKFLSSRFLIRFMDFFFSTLGNELKYGFHNKSFVLNAPLVSCPIPVIRFRWLSCCSHPKQMTRIGQLTRGAFRINDLLWNSYFRFQMHQRVKLDRGNLTSSIFTFWTLYDSSASIDFEFRLWFWGFHHRIFDSVF